MRPWNGFLTETADQSTGGAGKPCAALDFPGRLSYNQKGLPVLCGKSNQRRPFGLTQQKNARLCWCWGAGITALLWGFLLCFSDIYFAANDDQFILRAMTGFQPGGTPDFHPFLLGFYVYPLRWLQRFFPGVAWYSLLELLLLALALTVILKSLLQCWLRAGRRLRTGLLLCAGYAALYGSNYLARVTFTVTGAMLGAAAVAQILSIDCQSASDRSLLRAMTLAILLLILCYGLRQLSLVPVLGYCGIAFLLRFCSFFGFGKQTKRSARPMLVAAGLALLILGGLFAGRALEIRLKQKQDALQWQQARSQVLDYINLKSLPSEALESVGWTDEQRILLDKWNTMDEAISTEALRSVRKNWYNSETTTTAGAAIEDLRWRSPWFVQTMVVLFGLGLFALFCAFRNRRENPWLPLALLMTGLLCFLFFCYLALKGRLPYRAVTVALLPAATMVFCLLGECGLPRLRKSGAAVLCAVLALGMIDPMSAMLPVLKRQRSPWDYNTHADMDAQALAHPDLLLIYSTELVNDMRMFPDMSQGVPQNLTFWGGWSRGSDEYNAKLAAFGLDGEHFTAADWLRPELRFISLKEEPDEALLAYLRSELGTVQWEAEKVSAGLYFFRFFQP